MGKNKLAKFAEMETLTNVFQPRHEEIFHNDYHLKGKWGKKVFRNDNPIVLEVGCGKGEYTVGLGKMFPQKNFIGLDIKGARMWTGAKQAVHEQMNNVAFLRTRAEMLDSIFAPEEISEIWITFPDPQMAKVRKRLTGTRFLCLYRRILKDNGIIHLKTDSPFLYQYTAALVANNRLPILSQTSDLYANEVTGNIINIQTFYEQQWLARGKTIKYLQFALPRQPELVEPDIEIEKDDYHSEARFMAPRTKNDNTQNKQ